MIDRFGPLRIRHHDLPSLYAGKLAAILAREYSNLRVIQTLARLYPECVVGISDHSEGATAAVAAVALGAEVVEKHVTLSQESAGPDHWFSMEIGELAGLVSAVEDTWYALGDG